MLTALLLASATPFSPWMSFERSPSFKGSVVIDVGTKQVDDIIYYEFRRIVQSGRGEEISWTDTKRCPQARQVLVSATRLDTPAVSVPFLTDDYIAVTADGVGYRLKASAQYENSGLGEIEFSSNSGTPLARWVDQSLSALESCWTTTRLQN